MPEATHVVRILLSVLGLIGLITNASVFVALLRVQLGSHVTNVLFRSQCIFDGLGCLTMLLRQIIGDRINTGLSELDEVLCYIWHQDNFFWIGPMLAAGNLTCICWDRLTALFRPVYYRQHQRRLIGMFICYTVLTFLLVYVPQFLRRQYKNGQCRFSLVLEHPVTHVIANIQAFLVLIILHVFPAVCLLTSHAFIIWKIRRLKMREKRISQTTTTVVTTGDSQPRYRRSVSRLVWTTATLSVIYFVCHSFDSLNYALAVAGISDYKAGSPCQQAGLAPIVFCCAINPCVLVNMSKPVRKAFLSMRANPEFMITFSKAQSRDRTQMQLIKPRPDCDAIR
ncbi:unnamed protein product [Echinostoma caproni]|uniref:G_PROTEIN_RECEP_F1_2 domain-containing protein n=1 Tax=Echinostoma caproni TaxID=27848 RepID=A0A183A9U0_9TREM|nr:unnamed protein product [Echinostoma caproni]